MKFRRNARKRARYAVNLRISRKKLPMLTLIRRRMSYSAKWNRYNGANNAVKNVAAVLSANRAPRNTETVKISGTPRPGDYVRIKGQTSIGLLKEISGKKAVVVFGTMQVVVDAKRLVLDSAPEKKVLQDAAYLSRSTRKAVDERKNNFKPDIDVRGMRGDEALRTVMSFVDDAQLLGVARIRILHGTGTGALREVIRQYLRTVPGNVSFHDEHVQFGGSGITVVDFQ